MKLVGKMIKWQRNKKGYTQEQLADGICSVTQLSKIENNLTPANDEILLDIADRLGISKEKLTNQIDAECEKFLKQWLGYIHEFDLPNAKVNYEKLKEYTREHLPYDIEFLYDLSLFGYYIITEQLKEADELRQIIYDYEEIFEEVDPYSFHKFLGIYLKNKGLFIDSLRHLKVAEKVLRDVEDPELLLMLAIVNSHLENVLTSNSYARRALRIFQEKLYYTRIIECEIILSSNYTFVHEFSSAKKHLQRLISIIDDKFDQQAIVKIYFHISLIHVLKRELDEAEKNLKYCLQFDVNEIELMHSRYLIAHMYYLKGEHEKAIQYIEEGTSFAEEYKLDYYLIKFRTLKLVIEDDKKSLLEYLRKRVIPFFRMTGQAFDLKYYYQLLGLTLYKLKKYKNAAEILMTADQQRKQLMDYGFDEKN